MPITHSPISSTQATNSSRGTAAKSRAQLLIGNGVIKDDPAKGPQGRQRNLDGLALAAELFVELVLGLGVRAGQKLVEHVDHLIDGVAVTLPEKADQSRTATWLGEFTQSSDRRLPHLVEQGPLVVGIEPREIDPQARP